MQLGSYVGGLKWLPLGLDFISGWVKDRFIIVGENISLGLGGGGVLMFWNLQYFRFLKGVQYAGLFFFLGGGDSSFGILFTFVLGFVWRK